MKVVCVKIPKMYRNIENITGDEYKKALYDAVRGNWRAKFDRISKVDYVFAVVNNVIVEVYKPTQWYICDENIQLAPQYHPETDIGRVFFEGTVVPNSEYKDRNITEFGAGQKEQAVVRYLELEV